MSEDVGGASFLSGSVWYSDPTLRATSQRALSGEGLSRWAWRRMREGNARMQSQQLSDRLLRLPPAAE